MSNKLSKTFERRYGVLRIEKRLLSVFSRKIFPRPVCIYALAKIRQAGVRIKAPKLLKV